MNSRRSHCVQTAIFCTCLAILLCSPFTATAQERGMSRDEVIKSLEAGVVALRTIDRHEEAEHLLNILRDYANQRREEERERPRPRRETTEREIGRQHLKIMRFAFEALKEADKEDAADLMERAIHARELRLEGADGPDARKVFESAPNRGAETELLLLAAKLLRESGQQERAQAVQELGERFQETLRRNRERTPDRERADDRERGREREPERSAQREGREAMERLAAQAREQQQAIRELAEQLERLARSSERLQQELRHALRRE